MLRYSNTSVHWIKMRTTRIEIVKGLDMGRCYYFVYSFEICTCTFICKFRRLLIFRIKNVCFSDVDILRNTYIIVIYTYDLQAIMLHYVQNNYHMLLFVA